MPHSTLSSDFFQLWNTKVACYSISSYSTVTIRSPDGLCLSKCWGGDWWKVSHYFQNNMGSLGLQILHVIKAWIQKRNDFTSGLRCKYLECFLPDNIVSAPSVDSFKNRSDKFWAHQEVSYNFECELCGTGTRSIV